MRDIKFRAWDNVFKEYDNSYFVIDEDGSLFELDGDKQNELDAKRFVVEQFTGLTDENGKDIYEGDIVKNPNDNCLEAVIYKHAMFITVCFKTLPTMKIVGNIHENANLLEGQK